MFYYFNLLSLIFNGFISVPQPSPNPNLQRLLTAYPDYLQSAANNQIVWKDGTIMQFDDNIKNKKFEQLLNNPDLEDMFAFDYPKSKDYLPLARNQDAGRIRYEEFFLKMYGRNKLSVQKNLKKDPKI